MQADDEVCMCFHVSFRKLINFKRRTTIARASQLSECFGAGTGCGWCRKVLRQLAEIPNENLPDVAGVDVWVAENFPAALEQYAANRSHYREKKNAEATESP